MHHVGMFVGITLLPHCGFLAETSRMMAIAQVLGAHGKVVIMSCQGSVQTAACSGTPFVACPWQPEQELNVAAG